MKPFFIAFSLFLASTAFALQTNPPQQTSKVSIRGKVLQEPGEQPIRKATVKLRQTTSATQFSATTDSEGQFAIDDVQPGQYLAVIERPGFVQSSGGHEVTISVQPETGKNDLILHMQSASIITGKVLDLDGDPMPDVHVTADRIGYVQARRDDHDFGNGTTNDLGEFRISGLRPGRYKIWANMPAQQARPTDVKENNNGKDQAIYLTTYYPGVLDENQAGAVEVHAGAEAQVSFGVLIGKAFRVSGTVTGIPSGGTMNILRLVPKGGRGETGANQPVGDDGKFDFVHVQPGTYVVRVNVLTFGGGRPGMQTLRLGEPIEVTNANVESLRLQAEPPGLLRGKFRLDTTDQKFDWHQLAVNLLPVEEHGGEIALEGMEGPPPNCRVNGDGTFEIKNVPGGTYQLVVGANSNNLRDYFTKSVNLGGRDVADSNFQVASETFLDVVISANGATITGTVVDANGQPVASAKVVDVPSVEHRSRQDLYQSDATDASGHFSLSGLSPGKYTVLAFEESPPNVRQPEFLRTYESRGETVQLDEGARKNVALKLIPIESDVQ